MRNWYKRELNTESRQTGWNVAIVIRVVTVTLEDSQTTAIVKDWSGSASMRAISEMWIYLASKLFWPLNGPPLFTMEMAPE
tara:strand:- start:30 stop:272 length:243 start_codon:yes stop_codon:yes gene_type:complete